MRKKYLDWLRALAIMGVMLVHVVAEKLNGYAGDFSWQWLANPVWGGVGRGCVVIFVLISGATLLGKKEENWKKFLTKRWLRLLLIYILWQIVYYWRQKHELPSIQHLITQESTYHLWYMRMILGVYLLVPPLRLLLAKLDEKKLKIILGGWTMTVVMAGMIAPDVGQHGAPLSRIFSYGVLLLWGYYLSKLPERKNGWLGIGGWLAAMIIMTAGLISSWTAEGWFDERWHNNLSPLVLGGGIGLFYGLSQMEKKLPKLKMVEVLSKASFGIYLVHLIPWENLKKISYFDGTWPNDWLGVPLAGGMVLIISWIVVVVYQQISTRVLTLLKKVVG